jgi:hypothetical protein
MKLRLPAAAAALIAVVALSGCADDLYSDAGAQQDGIGPAVLTAKICEIGSYSGGICSGSTGFGSATSYQTLVAYQVPAAVQPPDALSSTTDAATPRVLHYARSQSYSDSLQAVRPAADGYKWVGYLSDVIDFAAGIQLAYTETVTAPLDLPQGADGTPYRGPFKWLTINGFRTVSVASPADRAVDCVAEAGSCWSWGTIGGSTPTALPALKSLDTSDFALTAPAAQTVQAGNSIAIPFGWQMAGNTPTSPFAMTAQSDVPGASASPADPSLNPAANSTGSEPVNLVVPATAPAGDYTLTLKGALPNGQARTASVPVHVTPAPFVVADRVAPTLHLAGLHGQRLANAIKKGVGLDLRCSEACSLAVTLLLDGKVAKQLHIAASKQVKIGGKTFKLAAAGTKKVHVPLTKKARKHLRKAKSLKLVVSVAGKDSAGNATAAKKTLKLR